MRQIARSRSDENALSDVAQALAAAAWQLDQPTNPAQLTARMMLLLDMTPGLLHKVLRSRTLFGAGLAPGWDRSTLQQRRRSVLAARLILETELVAYTAPRATAAAVERIHGAVLALQEICRQRGDSAVGVRGVHLALVQAAGNPALTEIVAHFFDVCGLTATEQSLSMADVERQHGLLASYRRILEAFAMNAADEARGAMLRHLRQLNEPHTELQVISRRR
jgi:DNA-binding FadR family transcriptional regulator